MSDGLGKRKNWNGNLAHSQYVYVRYTLLQHVLELNGFFFGIKLCSGAQDELNYVHQLVLKSIVSFLQCSSRLCSKSFD